MSRDHVHIFFSIPPNVSLSDLVRRKMKPLIAPNYGGIYRGRELGCPSPPAQIRTCALTHSAPTSVKVF